VQLLTYPKTDQKNAKQTTSAKNASIQKNIDERENLTVLSDYGQMDKAGNIKQDEGKI